MITRLKHRLRAVSAVLIIAPIDCSLTSVQAETHVEGDGDVVRVEMREASLDEVLAAVGAAFNLNIHAAGSLDRSLSGRCEGSLQRVLSCVLTGQNYVLKHSSGGVEVTVL